MTTHPRPCVGRRTRTEAGYAAILVAVFASTVFFPLAAISVDVARWYVEISRLQNAADAAALAGVTWMPDHFDSATTAALASSAENGYPNGGNVHVTVTHGPRPTQLRVTITSRIPDSFAAAFNDGFSTMTATSVADFNGPAPMGSPCNAFGNEPDGTPLLGPIGSQIVAPAGATCPRVPQFWANVHGPNVYKTQGDRYSSRYCQGGEDGCTGTTNDEFDPRGYIFAIRVAQAAVGQPVTIQLYDPAYVSTDSRCATAPTGTINLLSWNPFTTLDSILRYLLTTGSNAPSGFCTGDDANSGLRVGAETPTITSFGLRGPSDTYEPHTAPPITTCVRQYPGFIASQVTASTLRSTSGSYKPKLAAVFHQWVSMCTFTPQSVGDYYLQVRTDVPLAGSEDSDGVYVGNQQVFSQAGDNAGVTGNGSNRFAIRAVSSAAGSLSVAGWERMTIYANANTASSTFNLVRVVPSSASKTLDFSFFDAGDAAASGIIQVLPPVESSVTLSNCTGSGKVVGALTNCRITGISAANGWNGRTQHVRVQIPSTYTCNNASSGGCWFRVQVSFGTGTVTDVTTWTAIVDGDPVRIIE